MVLFSEAAIYFNPSLASNALDLVRADNNDANAFGSLLCAVCATFAQQYECGHHSWLADKDGCLSSLPYWGAKSKPKSPAGAAQLFAHTSKRQSKRRLEVRLES